MTRYAGTALVVNWLGSDLGGYFRTIEVTEEARTIDASAGNDTHEYVLAGLLSGNVSATFLVDAGTAGTANFAAMAPQVTGTLVYYPEGTAVGSGHVKHTFSSATLTGRSHRLSYDGPTEVNVTWMTNVVEAVTAVA